MTRFSRHCWPFLILLPLTAMGSELRYVISGVQDPLLGNVREHLERFAFAETARISAGRFDDLIADAEDRTRAALKPYGYYAPELTTSLIPDGDENWRMHIRIRPGQPLRISAADIRLEGSGQEHGGLIEWQRDWPLQEGQILVQPVWDAEKKRALSIAEAAGFLQARFTDHRLLVNPAENSAESYLVLDSGPRFVFGGIDYDQQFLHPWVLQNVPRFDPGMPYSKELMDQFRLDLWRTGYFSDLEVRENRNPQTAPPQVDLAVQLQADVRDTYQGTLGFGTDTGVRLQGLWSRHRLSPRGDRVDLGTGYREIDDEFSIRADYRIPRRTAKRQFWVASSSVRAENQDLEFKRAASDEDFVNLANGEVQTLDARFGRLHVRDRKQGFQQIHETIYTEFVRESFDYRPGSAAEPEIIALANDPRFAGLFRNTINSLVVGIEWDWPAIRGQAFDTEGHRERAWLFTAQNQWGSERTFTQAYVSSRRSYLYGERWKLLLRAEFGYSDADVRELSSSVNGEPFKLSVTQLPDVYRFKAGGSSSVRGYGFEELSNNDIGSNNIVTASIETEFQLTQNWSVAAFADIGNAFNDWDRTELRKGIGLGIRWYSIAGPIRVDVAQALDIDGKPWRLHFTMGSPLL